MKKFILAKALILFIGVLVIGSTISSCTKTVEVIKHDTTTNLVQAVDTSFLMLAPNWDAYSYTNAGGTYQLTPGATTYNSTAEGVKFIGQSYRLGARLQTKNEIRFNGKTIYYKWKVVGGGQYVDIVPQIKYDKTSNDGLPAIQGVDLSFLSLNGTFNGSTQVSENTWYYTRVAPVNGSDNYTVITASGNYDNKGGTLVLSKVIPIYTKAGYIGIRIGDPYGATNAYGILGECKVASN